MIDKGLLFEYEHTLTGEKPYILPSYFCYTQNGNEQIALAIIKYANEKYLKWSPEELRDYLTWDIIEMLALSRLVKYIVFPPELDPSRDLFCIAWKIYPETVHIDEADMVLNVYKNLLRGDRHKFPKGFFDGEDGFYRAGMCLRYMIEQYLSFNSVEEAYHFFNSQKVASALKKFKLFKVCRDLYENPLEYLHDSLSDTQKNEYLYRFLRFDHLRKESILIVKDPAKGGSEECTLIF